jgi:hypothetical protein
VLDAKCGAVTVVQRFDSSLRVNIHFHSLVLDGVYPILATAFQNTRDSNWFRRAVGTKRRQRGRILSATSLSFVRC